MPAAPRIVPPLSCHVHQITLPTPFPVGPVHVYLLEGEPEIESLSAHKKVFHLVGNRFNRNFRLGQIDVKGLVADKKLEMVHARALLA